MTEPAHWSTLRRLKPSLAPSVDIRERWVRGQLWAFVENTVTGQHIRLNNCALQILRRFDGSTTLEAIVNGADKNSAVPSDELCACLATLCQSGIVTIGIEGDAERLLSAHNKTEASRQRQRWLNPLALRLPLHDPDDWLAKLLPHCKWLFTRKAFVGMLLLLCAAALTGLVHAGEIGAAFTLVAASPEQWWLLVVLYPLMKALHELAHALCIKRWGGSVHEIGVTFLVLVPVPHVDASAAWLFPHRYQRMSVSASGMLAEGICASLGLLLWSLVEPGTLRDVAFAIALTGSLSTILFNANPLMKFDGYYLLQDWLDMPNLASRSIQYYRFLIRHYLFRVDTAISPVTALGERRWLLAYGAGSIIYRWIITLTIALFLAQQYLFVGVLLAALAITHLAFKPTWLGCRYLLHSSELIGHRLRAGLLSGSMILSGILLVLLLPLPASTQAQGIVWVPNQAQVFAVEAGRIIHLAVRPGQWVEKGQLLMRLEQPALVKQRSVAHAEIKTTDIAWRAALSGNKIKAGQLAIDLSLARRRAAAVGERIERLAIYAQSSGRFSIDGELPLIGQLVGQGDLLGYVVNPQAMLVRAVISQRYLGRVQSGIKSVSVRLAENFGNPITATQIRQIPAGNFRLPSPSLANNGSGGIAVAAGKVDEMKTLEQVFHVEMSLPANLVTAGIGGRVYVKMTHQPEPLGRRWWRSLRQLLLTQLTV